MSSRTTNVVILAVAFGLGGCGYPGTKDITSFSDSAVAVSQLAKSAAVLNVELDGKVKASRKAVQYAKGGVPRDFPPPPGEFIGGKSDKDWAVRTAVLNAIIAYATSIRAASDTTQGTQVRESLSGLSLALTDFATASAAQIENTRRRTAALAEAQQIQNAGEIVATVAGYAVNVYAASEIRRVMHDVHPALEEIVAILKKDFAALSESIKEKTDGYVVVIQDKLVAHSTDHLLSTAQKYDLYMMAATEFGALLERVEVVSSFPRLLDKLVKAHGDLKNNVDSKTELVAFLTLVQELAAKVKKFQDVERSLRA